MNTQQMLEKLQYSKNEQIAHKCKAILNSETTINNELRYSGGFLTAVLKGNYEEAIQRADFENRKCLLDENK